MTKKDPSNRKIPPRDPCYSETVERPGRGVSLTTSSWREGVGRRSSAALRISDSANPAVAAQALTRFSQMVGTGTLRENVLRDLAAAQGYARSIYARAGLPYGEKIFWVTPYGKRFWRTSQRVGSRAHKRWCKVYEYELVGIIEQRRKTGEPRFGEREHWAARLLRCSDVLETLLATTNPDPWQLAYQAMEFEECRRFAIDQETTFLEDPAGRTLTSFADEMVEREAKLCVPKKSALRKHLPDLQQELDRLSTVGQSKHWKAPLVALAVKKGVRLDKRSIQRQLDTEIEYGNLVLPEHFRDSSPPTVTGTFLSLHRASAPPAMLPRHMKRRGNPCTTSTTGNNGS